MELDSKLNYTNNVVNVINRFPEFTDERPRWLEFRKGASTHCYPKKAYKRMFMKAIFEMSHMRMPKYNHCKSVVQESFDDADRREEHNRWKLEKMRREWEEEREYY